MNNSAKNIKKICTLALFTALAYVCVLVSPIKVQFLSFNPKDAVIAIGAMLLGPVSGLIMSVVTSLIEMVTVSTTGPWGMLMNVISSAVFSCSAALVYKYRRKMSGAIMGLLTSVVLTTAVMMGANLLITPLYMGVSTTDVAKLIPTLLLPFNFTKTVLNAAIVLLLYKPLTTALRKTGLASAEPQRRSPAANEEAARGESGAEEKNRSKLSRTRLTIAVTVAALVLIAACIAVFVLVLGGEINI